MMPAPKTPLARLFSAQVLAGDPSALHRIETELVRNAGNLQKTAEGLGIGEATLYRWGDDLTDVAKLLAKHRRGRIGRGPGQPKEPPRPAKKRGR